MPTTERRPALAATRALRRAIKQAGAGVTLESALDRRTVLGRRVAGLRDALVDQLGGPSVITPTQALLC